MLLPNCECVAARLLLRKQQVTGLVHQFNPQAIGRGVETFEQNADYRLHGLSIDSDLGLDPAGRQHPRNSSRNDVDEGDANYNYWRDVTH